VVRRIIKEHTRPMKMLREKGSHITTGRVDLVVLDTLTLLMDIMTTGRRREERDGNKKKLTHMIFIKIDLNL